MTQFRLNSSTRLIRATSRGLLCAALIALCAVVNGQDSNPFPAAPIVPLALDEETSDYAPFSPPISESGFWFLDTHRSPQTFDAPGPRFCPGVRRFECGQGFQASSFQALRDSLEPGVPVCIMVHGSFVDTPSFCRESQQTWHWLRSASHGQPMQMVYFHWPSYRMLTPFVAIDTNILGRRAARNGYYLAELIQSLPSECPVCLIGHSHGSRVISAGLHLLAGGAVQGVRHPFARVNGRSIRTVFTGSAIDHHWFNPGQRYDRALCSTECLLNMTNHKDPALMVYPLRLPLLVRPPLGLTGLTSGDRRRLGPLGNRVYNYDVTQAIGSSHLWPYYFQLPGLAMAIRNYVYFPDRVTPMTVASDNLDVVR